MIGPYGPFRIDPYFTWSNFGDWGEGHNAGFEPCIEACRGAEYAFDVGAHIGLVTLPMSQVIGDRGRVVAFEPAEANARMLAKHLRINSIDNVDVVQALVGSESSDGVPFYEMDDPSGMNSIVSYKDAIYRPTQRTQVTLDSFCLAQSIHPQVVKIDVEGAEIDVLRGARQMLLEQRPRVFLSVHPKLLEMRGQSTSELAEMIAELSYECRTPAGGPVSHFVHGEYVLEPIRNASI